MKVFLCSAIFSRWRCFTAFVLLARNASKQLGNKTECVCFTFLPLRLSNKDLKSEDDTVRREKSGEKGNLKIIPSTQIFIDSTHSHLPSKLLFLFCLHFLDSASAFCPPDVSAFHNARISVRAWRHWFLLKIWEMDTVELTYINHPEQLIYDLASESNRKQQGHTHMATPSPQNRNRHSVYLQQQFIFKITFYSDRII